MLSTKLSLCQNQIQHYPTFICSSLLKHEPTWLRPEKLRFKVKKDSQHKKWLTHFIMFLIFKVAIWHWCISYTNDSWVHDDSSLMFKVQRCEIIDCGSIFSNFMCWPQQWCYKCSLTLCLGFVTHFVQKKTSGKMFHMSQNQRFWAVDMLKSGMSVSATAR